MPTYEYQCKKCEHKFEAFQQIKAESLKVCPKCQGELKRLIGTGGGFIFKGSGFYATDYRSKEYQKSRKEESQATCPASGNNEACKSCPVNKDKDA